MYVLHVLTANDETTYRYGTIYKALKSFRLNSSKSEVEECELFDEDNNLRIAYCDNTQD